MNADLLNAILPLDRDAWQGYCLPFHYVSNNYYNATIVKLSAGFNVSFVKKPFEEPYEKMPDESDKLFSHWWDDIKSWGVVDNGALIAVIETAVEQ